MHNLSSDVLIIGGGLAGLSLASALIDQNMPHVSINIIEPRTLYTHDRHWCYWKLESPIHEDLVKHSWTQWLVRKSQAESLCLSFEHPYQHVESIDFYNKILKKIENHPLCHLHLGVKALNLIENLDQVVVKTDQGIFRAAYVFDSRPIEDQNPPSKRKWDILMYQHFVGWQIQTSKPIFDPETPVLMDFDLPQKKVTQFFYVLPFSETQALIENIYFSSDLMKQEEYENELKAYIEKRYPHLNYEVTYREFGKLPMSTIPTKIQESARLFNIGMRGGYIKPSSGYAFLAIQKSSEEMAYAFAFNRKMPPRARPLFQQLLDEILLILIKNHPNYSADLFYNFFTKTPFNSLLNILSDRATILDLIKVFPAIPFYPLANSIGKRIKGSH